MKTSDLIGGGLAGAFVNSSNHEIDPANGFEQYVYAENRLGTDLVNNYTIKAPKGTEGISIKNVGLSNVYIEGIEIKPDATQAFFYYDNAWYSVINLPSRSVFNPATTYYVSCTALDSTHVVISYQDSSNLSYGTAVVGTISGTSISFGSEVVFNAVAADEVCCIALDSTRTVIGYKDVGNSSYGTAIVQEVFI